MWVRLVLMRCAPLLAALAVAASADVDVEIIADNCPVYRLPERNPRMIVYRIHRGSRYGVLESRRIGGVGLFYRIRYSERENDTGWVYDSWARPREPQGSTVALRSSLTNKESLYYQINRLIEAYNDEKSELTKTYGLRPFPSFGFDLNPGGDAGLSPEQNRIRVPLTYRSEEPKLRLERATKFLMQLIMMKCFTVPAEPPEEVEVVIRFPTGSPLRLVYRAESWRRLGQAGLDEFWSGAVVGAKEEVWR